MKRLTEQQLILVNDTLSNDEDSSDEELIAYLINEWWLDNEQATAAIKFRPNFRTNPLAELIQVKADELWTSTFVLQNVYGSQLKLS